MSAASIAHRGLAARTLTVKDDRSHSSGLAGLNLSHFAGMGRSAESIAQIPSNRQQQAKKIKIPLNASYNLKVTGVTYVGNTSIPVASTQYSPIEAVSLPGRLTVEKTLTNGFNFDNGKNTRDIGFFVGTEPLLGVNVNKQAGATWFATNSKVFRRVHSDAGSGAAIDVVFTTTNVKKGTMSIRIDANASRSVQDNSFNWRTSSFSAPKQILVGDMQLQFRNNGQQVTGSARFYGAGYVEPGAYGYEAFFSGTRRTTAKGN